MALLANDGVITAPEAQTDVAAVQTRFDATVIPALRDPAALTISPAERATLRRLAAKVAELAARPIEGKKRDLWYRHNALEVTQPVIFCDPENGWNEIIRPAELTCHSPLARRWEMHLRKEIFWGTEMGDDYTIEPYFNVFHIHSGGIEEWGLKEETVSGGDGGSYRWESPIKTKDDLGKLALPDRAGGLAGHQPLLNQANDDSRRPARRPAAGPTGGGPWG